MVLHQCPCLSHQSPYELSSGLGHIVWPRSSGNVSPRPVPFRSLPGRGVFAWMDAGRWLCVCLDFFVSNQGWYIYIIIYIYNYIYNMWLCMMNIYLQFITIVVCYVYTYCNWLGHWLLQHSLCALSCSFLLRLCVTYLSYFGGSSCADDPTMFGTASMQWEDTPAWGRTIMEHHTSFYVGMVYTNYLWWFEG